MINLQVHYKRWILSFSAEVAASLKHLMMKIFNNVHRSRVRQSRQFWEHHKITLKTLSPNTISFTQQVSAYGLLILWQYYICGADMSMEVLGDSSLGWHYLWSVVHAYLFPRFYFLIPSEIILGSSVDVEISSVHTGEARYWNCNLLLSLKGEILPELKNSSVPLKQNRYCEWI